MDIFLERFAELCAERGLKEQAASKAATGSIDRIRNVRRNRAMPKAETIQQLAAYFGVSADWLLGRSDTRQTEGAPFIPESNAKLAEGNRDFRGAMGDADLPIWGTALGHSLSFDGAGSIEIEQTIFEPGEVVRYIRRPSVLAGVKVAYGLYIQGDSMWPRYEPGEVAIADPRLPVRPNDDVIVQLYGEPESPDAGRVVSVLIKRLMRRSASYYELRQFNPNVTFRVPAERVHSIHRIVPLSDMVGA